MSDDHSFCSFSETELAGLPLKFLKQLEKDENGKMKITLNSNHVFAVLEFCKVGLTRSFVAAAYGERCKVNLPVLKRLVELRHQCARLLGFSNYADYAVDIQMAKSSKKVNDFLNCISRSLTDLASSELAIRKELKRKEEGDVAFGVADLQYYIGKAQQQQFKLNIEAVKNYFPANLVLPGIFKICHDLFGLRFEEIADSEVWHSSVQLFPVFDSSSNKLIGYVYLDLYYREGKCGPCVIPLQNGSSYQSKPQIPVALLLSPFRYEFGGQSRMLQFFEVVGLFLEFGHVVHHICNRASYSRFSGLPLDPDFADIPALVLENWISRSPSRMKCVGH
jgi:thimet oligopeptidase